MTKQKTKYKKCPVCKGLGKVKINKNGLSDYENKEVIRNLKRYV